MSLNILQHKSWHVWTQKNIEKVRKDQEEHRKQEDRKRKRELDIEQERRLEALRERNKRLKGEPADDDSGPSSLVIVKQEEGERAPVAGPGKRRRGKAVVAVKHERDEEQEAVAVAAAAEEPLKHVNFFEDLELQQRSEDTRNPEHEAEKKAQADRDARFYTTYLGQSAAETQKVKPWYYGPPAETPALPPEKERKQQRFKAEKDPLSAMGVFLQRKKQIESIQAMHANGSTGTPAMLARSMKIAAQMSAATTTTTITAASSTTLSTTGSAETKEKKEKKDKKKEKKRRKKREEKKKKRQKSRKHESSSSSDSDSDSSSSDDDDDGAAEAKKLKLLQLRAERMRREAEAKGKTRQLLFGNSQGVPTPAVNAGAGQYSSGFAPHIGGILRVQDRERRAQDRERREQHHRHEDRRSTSSSSYSSSSSSSSASHHRHRRHYSDSGHLEGRERGGASLRDNY